MVFRLDLLGETDCKLNKVGLKYENIPVYGKARRGDDDDDIFISPIYIDNWRQWYLILMFYEWMGID